MEESRELRVAHLLPPTESGGALLALPYARRQAIVIIDDEVLAAECERARNEAERASGDDDSLLEKILNYRPQWLSKEVHVHQPADETASAVATVNQDGRRILLVSFSQSEALELPVGHPFDKVVYIGDPASPSVYYPAAEFHAKTFEHKFSEAILLLMALGATTFAVHAQEGWGQEFAAGLDLPVPLRFLKGGGSGTNAQTKDSSLLFTARLGPTHEPRVPHGLVWYPREPAWRQVAAGRLEYGLQEFALDVRYDGDFGIDGAFDSAVRKAKLKLGGKFRRATTTAWQIEGSFAG